MLSDTLSKLVFVVLQYFRCFTNMRVQISHYSSFVLNITCTFTVVDKIAYQTAIYLRYKRGDNKL